MYWVQVPSVNYPPPEVEGAGLLQVAQQGSVRRLHTHLEHQVAGVRWPVGHVFKTRVDLAELIRGQKLKSERIAYKFLIFNFLSNLL